LFTAGTQSVRAAAQSAPDVVLAEKLGSEWADAEDVGDGLRVPFGQECTTVAAASARGACSSVGPIWQLSVGGARP
jgi:hypothetical protein